MIRDKMTKRLLRSGRDADGLDSLLSLLEKGYRGAIRYRNRRFDERIPERLPVPVISVGNIVAGGTGKTPFVRFLARMLGAEGLHVAILSRGYGGALEKRGGRVSDGKNLFLGPEQAGDEPFLLAKTTTASVYVGSDRYRSGLRAVAEGAGIVLLDDGFQHRKLYRDLDLVLLDTRRPLGNGRLLPRGSLREEPSALLRAHGLILTHCPEEENGPGDLPASLFSGHLPVFRSARRSVAWPRADGGSIPPERVLAFSGIADPEGFAQGLSRSGWRLATSLAFPDHHSYRSGDMRILVETARKAGAEALVTTAKDAVKLPDASLWPLKLHVLDVDMVFFGKAFDSWLKEKLGFLAAGAAERTS